MSHDCHNLDEAVVNRWLNYYDIPVNTAQPIHYKRHLLILFLGAQIMCFSLCLVIVLRLRDSRCQSILFRS